MLIGKSDFKIKWDYYMCLSHNCDDEYCNDMDGEDTMDTGREDVPNGHLMSTDVKICDDKAKGQDYYKRWVSKKEQNDSRLN